MSARFDVFKDKAGKFRFHLRAANGEIIVASQSYSDKKLAMKGINSVVKNAPIAKIEDMTVEVTDVKKKPGRPKAVEKTAKPAVKPKVAANKKIKS